VATIAGTEVGSTVAPVDVREASAVLAAAAAEGSTVSFAGGGTELGFGYPPERVDLLLRTEHLCGVVEYAPADMVVEVEAGIPLAALQKVLAGEGQRLALDVPHAELASIGGLLACNTFGPRRARFGTLRDLIVGVSLIRADGSRVRGGGKVVKNVAGFDLPKLAVGSLGTLGMIATATFRLHPMPETVALLRVEYCSASHLRRFVTGMLERRFEPAAMLAVAVGRGYEFLVLFEGFAAGVLEQAERFVALAAGFGLVAEDAADDRTIDILDEEVRTFGDLRLRFAAPPGVLERLEAEALEPMIRAFPAAKLALYPSLGVAFWSAYANDVEGAIGATLRARAAAERLGGNAVVLDARDPRIRAGVDVFGTVPSSFPLMKRLKERFDPEGRLNRGRFVGGL
jgi:glycolate oxidase FAD binding subunit